MIANLSPWFLGVGVVVAALAGWLWWRAAAELRYGWLLWRNENVPVMDAANVDGAVEIEATAASGGRTLRAPFTETPCLICEYEVQEYRDSGKSSHWETLAKSRDAVPFLLKDDTGSVAVDPEGASFALEEDAEIESGADETPPESVQRFLDDIGVEREEGGERSFGPISVKTGDRRRYVERRLDPGDLVHVYGQTRSGRTVEDVEGTVNAVIGSGRGTPRFRISEGSESTAIRNSVVAGAKYLLAGAGVVAVAAFVL